LAPNAQQLEKGDLLTIQQALDILPVGRTLLYQLVEEGQIRSIRCRSVGSRRGRILIFRDSLEDYIRDQAAPAPRAGAKVSVDDLLGRTPRRTKSGVASGHDRR
jgi:hypothetical protein